MTTEPQAIPLETVAGSPRRAPAAFSLDQKEAEIAFEEDVFEPVVTSEKPRHRFPFGNWFFGAVSGLLLFAVGLWVDDLITALFSRNDWIGYTGLALAGLAGVSLAGLLGRELYGLFRLRRLEGLQNRAATATSLSDAKDVAEAVIGFYATQSDMTEPRARAEHHVKDLLDEDALLAAVEAELLVPLDSRARKAITEAARRVSLVTTISPRALVDVAFVLFAAANLIRRIAEIYGVRPSGINFLRLLRLVVAHLAVTGTLAVSDGLAGQIVGHGIAARLSARLGEGVVNGILTARIGLAAIEVCRPMPFLKASKPRLADLVPGFNPLDS